MGRRQGDPHPPGVGGKGGKISRGVQRHYAANPRTPEHNQKIAAGRRAAHERRRQAQG